MLWLVAGKDLTTVVLQVFGSFEGIVTGGVPEFLLEPTSIRPNAFTWTAPPPGLQPGLLTLEFPNVVPDQFILTLQQRSRCLRNEFGGLLAPGKGAWPSPAVSPTSLVGLYAGHISNQLLVQVVGPLNPVCYSNDLTIVQQSTGDLCSADRLQGNQLVFTAPVSDWLPGDHAILASETNLCINQLGGKLQPFDLVIP